MPRYIDSDVLLAKCKAIISDQWNEKAAPASWAHAYLDFIDDIENVPTADVEPVRHGRWIHNKEGIELVCSVCGGFAPLNYFNYHRVRSEYCPDCGAKIDLQGGGMKNENL